MTAVEKRRHWRSQGLNDEIHHFLERGVGISIGSGVADAPHENQTDYDSNCLNDRKRVRGES